MTMKQEKKRIYLRAALALAALLLVFLFIKIVLLIIKCISDLVLFWKK